MPPPPPVQTRKRRAGDAMPLRPLGHQARELARLGVVAAERPVGAQPRRAEEHDRVVDALPLERVQGLEVLGEDAQRPRGVAVEERVVPVGEQRIGGRHRRDMVPQERLGAKRRRSRSPGKPSTPYRRSWR